MRLSRYLFFHVAFTLAVAGLALAYLELGEGFAGMQAPVLWGIGLCSVVKLIAYQLQAPGMKAGNYAFSNRVMMGSMFKMLTSLVLVLAVYGLRPTWVVPFTIAYFFLYFILTGFEVKALQSNLRANSEPEQDKI
jgi:hypothetical protein